MTTTSNQLSNTTAKPTIRDHLSSEKFRLEVEKALPTHITPDRFIRVALTALTKTPKLADCTQASLFNALLTCSQLGLEPDGRRAHLIPYGNQCQLIIDYKGLIELAKRSGEVESWSAEIVKENDEFSWDNGIVEHKIDWRKPRGNSQCVYSRVRLKGGAFDYAVMTMDEVEAIRKRSRAGNNGPWVTDFDEMAKKGLALDTPIPTPSGWATMGTLKQGNHVFDMYGQPTQVTSLSEIKKLKCFRVKFTNGDSVVCDDEHRWLARCGTTNAHKTDFHVFTVNQLMDSLARGESVTVPVQGPLALPEIELPIEPYILGYWLGNGAHRAAVVTCGSSDVDFVKKVVCASKYQLGSCRKDKRTNAYYVGITKGFLTDLKKVGVFGDKHIPSYYLRASIEQRRALLAGLMDSDGHLDKARGRAHFYNTNKRLADGVAELVTSLGDVPNRAHKVMRGFGKHCPIEFVGWKPTECCTLNPRKAANFQKRKIKAYRAIASIEKVEPVPTRCIAVDSPTHTYLAGLSMAPTHNTVIRRHSKYLTLSPEFRQALDADDDAIDIEPAAKPERTGLAAMVDSLPEPQGESTSSSDPIINIPTREELLAKIENYMLDKNVSDKAFAKEIAAIVENSEGLNWQELPAVELAKIIKHLGL